MFFANACTFGEVEALRNSVGKEMKMMPYFAVVVGLLTLLLNAGALLAMLWPKVARKQKMFLLIRLICFTYCIFGVGLLISGSFALYRLYGAGLRLVTQQGCFFQFLLLDFSLRFLTDVSLFTGLDRCLAVVAPKFYVHVFKRKLTTTIMLCIILHCTIMEIVGYFYTSDQVLLFCSYVTIFERSYFIKSQMQINLLLAITLVVYLFLMFWIRLKMRTVERHGDNISQSRQRMNVKLIVTLFMCVGTFCITTVVGNVVVSFALSISDLTQSILTTRFAVLSFFDGILHFILLYCRMGEFRKLIHYSLLCQSAATKCSIIGMISSKGI
ncbi:hypothetical protein T4E_10040 [Trichinella pseudospiralis]|uniref:G-protein coupled receptors family 1 profile domain-containing protein n=1 Tax=Trichinella pseudospiralis TaxID=6337 RepID=A0A0V0XKK7_TRIPS|nr:hypothetical protein T4E_10040 [Trichinella pseudospiralis]